MKQIFNSLSAYFILIFAHPLVLGMTIAYV